MLDRKSDAGMMGLKHIYIGSVAGCGVLLLLIPALIILPVACSPSAEVREGIWCDCEQRAGEEFIGVSASPRFPGLQFGGAAARSTVCARSGDHSVCLDSRNPYGLTYRIPDAVPGECFRLRAWRHRNCETAYLVAAAENIECFYVTLNTASKTEGDWELLELWFNVPDAAAGQDLVVYVWNPDTLGPAYFDDFMISCLPASPRWPGIEESVFTDARDGQIYRTVRIGDQWWMAENLNFAIEGSRCYGDLTKNCDTHGRLYSWQQARMAAPEGWRLPDDEDWMKLERYLGMPADTALKYGMRGRQEGQLLKQYGMMGFNALPSGMCDEQGRFYFENADLQNAYFWTATETDSIWACCREVAHESGIGKFRDLKKRMFSIRCVRDAGKGE